MSTQLQLDTGALKAIQHRIVSDLRRAVPDALGSWADSVLGIVGVNPKFKPRSGELQRATKWRVNETRSGGELRFSNAKKYAAAIEWGAKPHVIRARRAPFLVFFWEKMGRWVRTKKVNHPGNKPYLFLHNAIMTAERHLHNGIEAAMARIARH